MVLNRICTLFFICFYQFGISQIEQAWIYFTPKVEEETVLLQPSLFLTTKAISRKEKFKIALDSKDLPINLKFLSKIKKQEGITYHTYSKWFNAVYVSGKKEDIIKLKDNDFVEEVFFLNRALNNNNIAPQRLPKKLGKNKLEKIEDTIAFSTDAQLDQINLKSLQQKGYKGKGITIAIIDSGFANVDLINAFSKVIKNNQILGGFDFVSNNANVFQYKNNSHGTQTFSTIAGYLEDKFIGTAIDANYYLFRTEDINSESPLEEALWIRAAEVADSLGVDIINTSLGYNTFDNPKYDYDITDMDGNTTSIAKGANIAVEKGMLVISSAGNLGRNNWKIITSPADSKSVFSIGAVGVNGNKAGFSSVGPTADNRIKPDVVALGVQANIIREDGTIGVSNGTSFSSPIIAGAMASLMQALPLKTPEQIMDLVRKSSSQFNTPDNSIGYGIPDFEKALNLETPTELSTIDMVDNEIQFFLNLRKGRLYYSYPESYKVEKYAVYSTSGSLVLSGNIDSKTSSIDISELNNGMYFFKTIGQTSFTSKFVK